MKKGFTILLAVILLIVNTSCVLAGYRYDAAYENIDGGRAALNMPAPFSVDTAIAKTLVASDDFNSSEGTSLSRPSSLSNGVTYADGAIKYSKTQTTEKGVQTSLTYSGNINPGEKYVFYCRIKTENVEGSAPVSLIQAYGGDKWLSEKMDYGEHRNKTGTNDWYEIVQMIEAPEGTTSLKLAAYMYNTSTGSVWFDDFKLYRIEVDPLEAVLLKPNYKGLIYGDGYGDIELDVTIGERTNYFNTEDLSLFVRLVDGNGTIYREASAQTLSDKMNFVFSSNGLENGDYYLQTVLTDKYSGNVISKKEHTIRKRSASYRPQTYLNENGRIIKNGEKKFLKRIFGNDLKEIVENADTAGVDTISMYDLWWAMDDKEREQWKVDEALLYMNENSITSHINMSGYYWGKLTGNASSYFIKKQEDILSFLTEIANDYKDNPVLEGYYLFDEPDPVALGEEIRWNNEIFSQADIDHPTFGVASRGWNYYGIYNKMTDILGIDPYPVTGKVNDNGISTDDLSQVGDSVREAKLNFPNRPVYFVLQGFHYKSRGDLRGPTKEELLNMAWQAICEGADGLDWYNYSSMMLGDEDEDREWLSKLNAVFNEVNAYEDIILSDEPVPDFTVNGGGEWLNTALRRYNGKTYLFAVNNTYYSKNASIKIDGLDVQKLSFEPLEVKKIELTQSDFLSPEAELKTMEFSHGIESFAVKTGEENIIYVPKKSTVINYSADISEDAKLYIGNREMAKHGKISVKNTDTFTVRVVAENGKNSVSRTYKVVRH